MAIMKILQKPISDLLPYPNNAKTHSEEQVNKIAASINEFGFNNPVLIDKKGGIIAGHGRVEAAKKVGLEKVPTIELGHLTEAQKKAYILADNRLAEIGTGWDLDLVSIELEQLAELDLDIELTGFDDSFLKMEETEGLTDEDEVPEVEAPISVEGDLWILGSHRLLCGDSTSIDAVERLMDGQKANMLHTDPPYGVDYDGVNNDDLKDDALLSFLTDALTSAYAYLHEGSNAYVWHADITALEFITAFRSTGFVQGRPSTIQWIKPSLVMSQGDYHLQNEPCLFGWKNGKGRIRVADRTQTTLWKCDRTKESKVHPTMKPVELCQRAIENSSMPNTIVMDLFGGSGSTLIACEKTNRNCRMMELDPQYIDVIINRWQNFTGKDAVHESGITYNAMKEKRDAA